MRCGIGAFAGALSSVAVLVAAVEPAWAQRPGSASQDRPVTYLDQGWTDEQRRQWYTTSQGSRLLPQSWLAALEQKDGTGKFLSDDHMRKLGYLPSGRPDGLPVGFVVDQGPAPDGSREPWVGMTCAACHTGEVTFDKHRLRIEGAPTLSDFQTFMVDFLGALEATRADSARLDRFVKAVLGANVSDETRKDLVDAFDKQIAWYQSLAALNRSPTRYGHGRVDAQGYILNRVAVAFGSVEPPGTWPADAPASYPFLWTTPWQEPAVQWNGVAMQPIFSGEFAGKTFDLGALARNIGELIGVFGSVDFRIGSGGKLYASSLRLENIIDLEDLIKVLKPPPWPQVLPPIDRELAAAGRELYLKHNCNGCHSDFDPSAPQKALKVHMRPLGVIGTDVWLACNVRLHESKLALPGGKASATTELLIDLIFGIYVQALAEESPKQAMEFRDTGRRRLEQILGPVARKAITGMKAATKAERAERCRSEKDLVYKAGPLSGIWATGPYLHNGSVPTLYDLLLPSRQRKAVFWVGGTEFDAVDVGFKSGPGDGPFEFRVRDADGKVIRGNDNAGHEFGTNLSDRERRALIEYLKTL